MKVFNRATPVVSGTLVSLAGLIFVVGGLWRIGLGGMPYYGIAGAGLLVVGIGLKGKRWSLWLYSAVWVGTLLDTGRERLGRLGAGAAADAAHSARSIPITA